MPLRAAPVDMFPDTKHCELVVVFSRESAVTRESVMPTDYALRDARQARQEQERRQKRKRSEPAGPGAAEVESESARKIAKSSE